VKLTVGSSIGPTPRPPSIGGRWLAVALRPVPGPRGDAGRLRLAMAPESRRAHDRSVRGLHRLMSFQYRLPCVPALSRRRQPEARRAVKELAVVVHHIAQNTRDEGLRVGRDRDAPIAGRAGDRSERLLVDAARTVGDPAVLRRCPGRWAATRGNASQTRRLVVAGGCIIANPPSLVPELN
jgi:hypothetical protein